MNNVHSSHIPTLSYNQPNEPHSDINAPTITLAIVPVYCIDILVTRHLLLKV